MERGFGLLMLAPAGRIFYTLDGTDPRLPGGDLSPEAFEFQGGDGLDGAHLVASMVSPSMAVCIAP